MVIQLKEFLMEIKGKVHCMFEQSGTFKNEFKKLGYEAYDYDIQNNFGETDYVMDLFHEIEQAYDNKPSIFDDITSDDLIVAFFPCIYFCGISQTAFSLTAKNYKNWDYKRIFDYILSQNNNRSNYFDILNKLVAVCLIKKIRLIFENPYSMQTFLRVFLKKPDVIDMNRLERGDYFVKPTGYWFFNCEPTYGESYQNDKKKKDVMLLPKSKIQGQCSEERSMISPDYARNWICDFVLGKKQDIGQLQLF